MGKHCDFGHILEPNFRSALSPKSSSPSQKGETVLELDLSEDTPFGIRYVIEGPLLTPNGRQLQVRTVWFIDEGGQTPRFVTAYPLKRRMP